MATLREYYEKDFSHCTKLHVKFPYCDEKIEGSVLYDFAGFSAFLALYVVGANREMDFYVGLLKSLLYGNTQLSLDGKVTLPAIKEFPGTIQIDKNENFQVLAQFFGDSEWISTKNIMTSRRVFIYSETNMTPSEIEFLKVKAKELGHELQFRAELFRAERCKHEIPLAFICHDSRDKEAVAKRIAIGLQKMLCPIWYDEFSLKIGDNLRESIEKGLKECKKCILILSPSFFSNKGWTKTEFDSIFTRQILEEKKLILPVWLNVSKHDVYEYSPSLLNTKGLDWNILGEENVCRQIYNAVII